MTQKDLITQLKVFGGKYEMIHAGKLLKIIPFLRSIKSEIEKVAITEKNIEFTFGKYTERTRKDGQWVEEIKSEGTKVKANKIKVVTKNSDYSFIVPVKNDFYNEVCEVLGIASPLHIASKKPTGKVIEVDSAIIHGIKKAMQYREKDKLRENMQCICLHFDNSLIEVVATTSFAVYISDTYKSNANSGVFELILHYDTLAKIAAIKPKEKNIKIELASKDQIIVEGVNVNLWNGSKYPDYNSVIPTYKKKMDFDKHELIAAIEAVRPAASKITSQVDFYIDENISLHARDVDFSTESSKELSYIKNSLPKMEIALNGNLLLKHLKSFKSDRISMYSDGLSTKMAIFTDGLQLACLMPLLVHN